MSVYIVGIVIGNGKIPEKQSLVHFFDGLNGLMQMLIFFMLGLLATPSNMLPILLPSFLIAVFITFIARPLSVFAILSPARCKISQQLLVSFAGLRGAASIVFAIIATVDDAYMQHDVFHIVFCIVLFSILFQGSFLPLIAKKLDMIDVDADILKTFNDYSGEVGLQFIKLAITSTHPWKRKQVKDLNMPPDTLLVALLRGQETIIPNGKTVILLGDTAIMSGLAFIDDSTICLKEQTIPQNSKWKNKTVSEFSQNPEELVILIKRKDHIIIPNGSTIIEEEDIMILNSSDNR